MHRLIYDVPRWHIYQHRRERGLRLVTHTDTPFQQFQDELFDRFFSGDSDMKPLSNRKRHKKAAQWESMHAAAEAMVSFEMIANACRNDLAQAALATEWMTQLLTPELQSSSTTEQEDEAHDAEHGLDNVQLDGEKPGDQQHESNKQHQARIERVAELIKDDERLKRIALLAGKFKRMMLSKQKSKVRHEVDDYAEIEQGGEVARLLPSEMIKLLRPRMKMAVMRDIAEKKALQYAVHGTEKQGRGPLVFCVDKSQSMEGDKDIWATAIGLALLEMANRQRRTFILLGFDHNVFQKVVVRAGNPLPKEQLMVAPRGGTNIFKVLDLAVYAVETSKLMKRADIILITDGESDETKAAEIREMAKKLDVSILGVAVQSKDDDEDSDVDGDVLLDAWCDEWFSAHDVNNLDDATATALFGK